MIQISLEKTYGVNIDDVYNMFKNAGIEGIEIFNSKHTLSDIKRYLKLAKRENMLISGGSDFHGEIMKPNVKLGGLVEIYNVISRYFLLLLLNSYKI